MRCRALLLPIFIAPSSLFRGQWTRGLRSARRKHLAPTDIGKHICGPLTGASCPWAVSGLPGWITFSGATFGTGSATVIDAIAQLCREKLNTDPFSGYLFIFRTRRGTAIRVLQYDLC